MMVDVSFPMWSLTLNDYVERRLKPLVTPYRGWKEVILARNVHQKFAQALHRVSQGSSVPMRVMDEHFEVIYRAERRMYDVEYGEYAFSAWLNDNLRRAVMCVMDGLRQNPPSVVVTREEWREVRDRWKMREDRHRTVITLQRGWFKYTMAEIDSGERWDANRLSLRLVRSESGERKEVSFAIFRRELMPLRFDFDPSGIAYPVWKDCVYAERILLFLANMGALGTNDFLRSPATSENRAEGMRWYEESSPLTAQTYQQIRHIARFGEHSSTANRTAEPLTVRMIQNLMNMAAYANPQLPVPEEIPEYDGRERLLHSLSHERDDTQNYRTVKRHLVSHYEVTHPWWAVFCPCGATYKVNEQYESILCLKCYATHNRGEYERYGMEESNAFYEKYGTKS